MRTTSRNPRNYPGRERRKGSFLIEFAIVIPTLVLLLTGVSDIGLILATTNQISQVCRSANVLTVRGIDLSQSANQQLLMRTANGLGLNVSGTYNPNPNGKGVIYITKVLMVGPNECAQGITNWDGKPSSCPNYGQYVIANRIVMGNSTRWASPIGKPVTTQYPDGDLYDADIATNTGNQAKGFGTGGIITLALDQYTYVAEVFVDVSNLNMFGVIKTPVVFMRNLS
jgi:hypothetical protein